MKEFNLKEDDKQNLIYYLDNCKYKSESSLIVNLLLEIQFDIKNNKNYIIGENDLMLMINSIYCMSKEIKELTQGK